MNSPSGLTFVTQTITVNEPAPAPGLMVSWEDWDWVKHRLSKIHQGKHVGRFYPNLCAACLGGILPSFYLVILNTSGQSDIRLAVCITSWLCLCVSVLGSIIFACAARSVTKARGEGIETVLDMMTRIESPFLSRAKGRAFMAAKLPIRGSPQAQGSTAATGRDNGKVG